MYPCMTTEWKSQFKSNTYCFISHYGNRTFLFLSHPKKKENNKLKLECVAVLFLLTKYNLKKLHLEKEKE